MKRIFEIRDENYEVISTLSLDFEEDNGKALLHSMRTKEHYRGEGLATSLVRAAIVVMDPSITPVEIHAFANHYSSGLLTRMGFDADEFHPDNFTEDGLTYVYHSRHI